MALELFFHRGKTQAPPKRITIRRRLVGRGSRLRTLGLAAGLLGLGLTLSHPAHAGTDLWNGPTTLTDWYAQPSFWSNGSVAINGFLYPGPGDDARNTFINRPMFLNQNASVNSFITNSAFNLTGGTFSGSTGLAGADTPNLHTLQVNNIFTLNGGTINNFTLAAGAQQPGGPVPAVVVTGSGGNALDNTVANATLDLATNSNAYLRLFDTNTINGAISLGAGGGNGLHLYNNATNLVLGSAGSLTGFGSVVQDNGGATITNNGIFNASNAAGNVLTLGVTTFNNNGTLEATNGGALALSNTFTNNSGALKAVGAGSLVTLTSGTTFTGTGTAAQGNLITASGGGKVVVDGASLLGTINTAAGTSLIFTTNGGNNLSRTTVNGNLDLTSGGTGYLRLFNADTVNGAITLGAGGGNGLHLYNNASNLTLNGALTGFGSVVEDNGGSVVTNNSTINANNAANPLTLGVSTFNNSAGATTEATVAGGVLNLSNTTTTNDGLLAATGGGVLNLSAATTLQSNADGHINSVGGTVNVLGATLLGAINGVGASTLVFNTNGGNNFSGTTANINLDLTSGGTGYLRLFNADTVNGAITLGAGGGNGLHLYNNASNLTLNGALTGFGSVVEDNGGSVVTNNSTINANNAAGNVLTLGVTNFNNSAGATTEATNGGALALSNAFTNNSGALKAVGAGSIVNLANGTTFTGSGSAASGNLITASGGGKVVVDGVNLRGTINTAAGTSLILTTSNNNLDNTTVNGNLDLATNSNAYLRLLDTDTINGAISLGTTAGSGDSLHLYNNASNLVVGSTGTLQGFGYVIEDNGGSTVTNNGLINANSAGNTLNINTSNFNNTGTAQVTNGAILSVTSTNATNSGVVNVLPGGTATFANGLTQTAGQTQVFGTLNASETMTGGVLFGNGHITGNIVNTGGTLESLNNNSGGSLGITGNYSQGSGGALEVVFGNNFHNLLTVSGQTSLAGTLGVYDLDTTLFTGTGTIGSKFAFLDYSGTLNTSGTANGFTQYFSNEVPDSNNSGSVAGLNGFTYELINDTANNMLDLQVTHVGSPVPEANSATGLGLLLLLGLGGMVVAAKRKKA